MILTDEIHFDVDSHLLFQLGEHLVAKRSIALAELVKNSYDADATEVTVRMLDIKEPGGTIIVEDDGSGMTFENLAETWMRIATYEKTSHPRSPTYERPRAGAKGIGRFACRLLSKVLSLETTARIDDSQCETTKLEILWDSFLPGTDVDQVSIPIERQKVSPDTPIGTRLELRDTRDAWDEKDIAQVRRDILSLVSPFPVETHDNESTLSDPGFNVILDIPEFEEYEGELSEYFLESAFGSLTGQLNSKGIASYDLRFLGEEDRREWKSRKLFPATGSASFQVRFFVYEKGYFEDVDFGVRDAQRTAREHAGVRIYLDTFRVFPYGQPGDDWLDLDADRGRRLTKMPTELKSLAEGVERPMLMLPGSNQLFGAVFLSRFSNEDLKQTVTRDRLMENEAFFQLKDFVRLGIEWMTVQYAHYQKKRKKRRKKAAKKEETNPFILLDSIEEEVSSHEDNLGKEITADIIQTVELARQAVQSRQEEQISELSMLRVLASTGTTISIFVHEISTLLGQLREMVGKLKEIGRLSPSEQSSTLGWVASRLDPLTESIEGHALQVGLLLGRDSRSAQISYALLPIVEDSIRPYKRHLVEYGITYEIDIPPALRLPPMYLCEVHSIVLNMFTNAIKAVKNRSLRILRIEAEEDSSSARIRILDTGPGILEERREIVFEPFVSDSEPDVLFGSGTGLGLTIVQEILTEYGGSVEFVEPPPGDWGACALIVLPKKED